MLTSHLRDLGSALVLLALTLFGVACATPQAPDLIQWQIEQSHPYVMAGDVTEEVINVDLAAALPTEMEARIPLNLSIVIDHSGSMNGEQMAHARDALRYMLAQLQDDDHVSVIAFSTQVEVLQPQTEWDDVDRGDLNARIDQLTPRGTTAMYEALQQAYSEVSSHYDAARINRVILLSDGIPNDPTYITSIAQQARSSNIAITTMGLGPYYNEDLMAQIADLSGGNYRFIKESGEIERFFLAEKRSMEQIVARNVSLTFNLGPGAELVQTLGGQASFNGRQVNVYLGDLSVSDPRQIALKLNVRAAASGARVEILDARLTWEDVIAWTGTHEAWAYVEAEATRDQALIDKHHNKLVVEKVGRLHAAWEMERAVYDYQAGRKEEARQRLMQASQQYREEKQAASSWLQEAPQAAPAEPTVGVTAGSANLESFMDDAIQGLFSDDESEEESEKTKVLIKSVKSRARSESGR